MEWKFQAGLHGIDLDKEVSESESSKPKTKVRKEGKENRMLFRDPSEYENMPPEERERLTQEMMGHWKKWADRTPL